MTWLDCACLVVVPLCCIAWCTLQDEAVVTPEMVNACFETAGLSLSALKVSEIESGRPVAAPLARTARNSITE